MSEVLEQAVVARVQRGDVRVPAYPPSAGKLQRVLGKPGFTIAEVVGVLRTDDVLAATTLRLANSAFYLRGEKASTLSTATVRIGSQQLHRLAVAAGTQRVFTAPGPLSALRRRAWRESLISAVVCETLALASGEGAEESFVAGLLHDIGRVLAITVLEELGCKDEHEAWRLVERFHVELGMVIAARWMLPPTLEEVIADHHVRDASASEAILRRVQASDLVVSVLDTEPTVTAERLGSISQLTPKECRLLAAKIPSMPEFIEAFGINEGAGAANISVPLSPAATPGSASAPRSVQLNAAGPTPVTGELVHGNASALTVHTSSPGRANWLVQVKVDDVAFWANVCGSQPSGAGGYDWELKPFALSPDVAAKWAAITEDLEQAA